MVLAGSGAGGKHDGGTNGRKAQLQISSGNRRGVSEVHRSRSQVANGGHGAQEPGRAEGFRTGSGYEVHSAEEEELECNVETRNVGGRAADLPACGTIRFLNGVAGEVRECYFRSAPDVSSWQL